MKVITQVNRNEILAEDVDSNHIIIGHYSFEPPVNKFFILTAQNFQSKLYNAIDLKEGFTQNNKVGNTNTLPEWFGKEHIEWYAFNNMKEACEFLSKKL